MNGNHFWSMPEMMFARCSTHRLTQAQLQLERLARGCRCHWRQVSSREMSVTASASAYIRAGGLGRGHTPTVTLEGPNATRAGATQALQRPQQVQESRRGPRVLYSPAAVSSCCGGLARGGHAPTVEWCWGGEQCVLARARRGWPMESRLVSIRSHCACAHWSRRLPACSASALHACNNNRPGARRQPAQ